jgi:hypothetical protein
MCASPIDVTGGHDAREELRLLDEVLVLVERKRRERELERIRELPQRRRIDDAMRIGGREDGGQEACDEDHGGTVLVAPINGRWMTCDARAVSRRAMQ